MMTQPNEGMRGGGAELFAHRLAPVYYGHIIYNTPIAY